MKWKVPVYTAAVVFGAAWLAVLAGREAAIPPSAFLGAASLAALVVVTSLVPVQVAIETKMTLETAVIFGALLVAPLPVVLLGVALGVGVSDVCLRRSWDNVSFNVAKLTGVTGLTWFAVHGLGGGPLNALADLLPIAVGAVLFLLVDVALVAGVVALDANFPFPSHFLRLLKAVWFQYAALLMLGALSSTLWLQAPVALPFLGIPLLLVHRSYRQQALLRQQTKDTLIMLADTIDNRDFYTAGHCHRVAQLASDLAKQMGLPEAERETVYLAARLHDIGKIGTSAEILLSKESLSPAEQAEMERHPVIGMQMLTELDQFFDVKEAVVFHHKRFDGTGYPRDIALPSYGLPLSAAVVSVADAYDAMTCGRRYRRAFTVEAALEEIRQNSGTQFHPAAVEALLELKGYQHYAAITQLPSRLLLEHV